MPELKLGQCLEVIADLIEGQRPALPNHYEVVWIKDHFVCRKIQKVDKGQYLIIELRARDIDNGLVTVKWDIITSRVVTLIAEGVIK